MSRFHRDRDASDALEPTASDQWEVTANGKAPKRTAQQQEQDALASLHKRMAGPSSAKAGMAVDQDEINRKIYEASKGSKYFENEKRNDERTTKQVESLLARRDEILRNISPGSEAWRAAEKRIDEHVLTVLEPQRDFSRHIVHADMDMFYAAVELKRDPSLKGKAFGVGSGVLVTASYEARKMGCRSGMATHVALALCPDLIVVKNDMSSYVAASQEVMKIFEEYDPNYAQMSLDEAYLDITPHCEMNNVLPDQVVTELRQRVRETTGLTVSVGIAPNKMLAKISSDKNKPDGQFRVEHNRNFIIDLMQDLPCRKIPGIGRVTERILSSLGVNTCGDIWTHRTILSLTFKGDMDFLLNAYLGIHSNIVEPSKRDERRSVGREHTFRPTSDPATLKDLLKQSADQVSKDLARLDYRGKTVTLTCKTDKFQRFTRAKTMASYQYKAEDLFSITSKLLDAEISARNGPFSLRLIGVRVSGLKDLREPETGGIKRLLGEQAKTSLQKRVKSADQHGNGVHHNHDEDFEAVMQRVLRESAAEVQQADDRQAFADTSDFQSPHLDSPPPMRIVCPICNRNIRMPADLTDARMQNIKLNEHIDRCLHGEGEGDIVASRKTSPLPFAQSSVKAKPTSLNAPTLDSFFRQRAK